MCTIAATTEILAVPGKRESIGFEGRGVAVYIRYSLTYGSSKWSAYVKGPMILMMSEVSQVLTGG